MRIKLDRYFARCWTLEGLRHDVQKSLNSHAHQARSLLYTLLSLKSLLVTALQRDAEFRGIGGTSHGIESSYVGQSRAQGHLESKQTQERTAVH